MSAGAALALLAALQGAPAVAAELEVTLHGIEPGAGHVLVAVCTRERFLGRNCPYTARAPATAGTARAVIGDIAPGRYAVQAFHDANDNMEVDRNFLGLPEEGMGFSNDARMRFGPPEFDDAAIVIGDDGARIDLRLQYLH